MPSRSVTPDETGSAAAFLDELAERANASGVIDTPWGAALGTMLCDGWRIFDPNEAQATTEMQAVGSPLARLASAIRAIEDLTRGSLSDQRAQQVCAEVHRIADTLANEFPEP